VTAMLFLLVLYAITTIMYLAFKFYRKNREALDVSLAYREIPPE